MAYCVINGKLEDANSASIHISDLALQRGYGIFDYFKILNDQPIFLDDHLDRFYQSASQMRLDVGCSREELKKLIFSLLAKNDLADSGVKVLLTGGYSIDGFQPGKANLIITQSALPSYKDANKTGIRIITYKHQRQMAEIKTIDYLMAIWLQPVLKEQIAQDVLYFDNDLVTECPRSNIFIVTVNDRILTPARNVLKGVIRKNLLKFADQFNISEADITLNDLYNAKEIFVTSTTKNILPVVTVDDRIISNGIPGPVTTRLSLVLDNIISRLAGAPKVLI